MSNEKVIPRRAMRSEFPTHEIDTLVLHLYHLADRECIDRSEMAIRVRLAADIMFRERDIRTDGGNIEKPNTPSN